MVDQLPPGALFSVAEGTIIVEGLQVKAGKAGPIGGELRELVFVTIHGRVNKAIEPVDVELLMSPETAFVLQGQLLDGLEAVLAHRSRT